MSSNNKRPAPLVAAASVKRPKTAAPLAPLVAVAPILPAEKAPKAPVVQGEEPPKPKKQRTELPRGSCLTKHIWLVMSDEALEIAINQRCAHERLHPDYVMFTKEQMQRFKEQVLDVLVLPATKMHFIIGTDFRGFVRRPQLKGALATEWEFMEFPKRKLERKINWVTFIKTHVKDATTVPWDADTIRDIRAQQHE